MIPLISTTLQKLETNSSKRLKLITLLESELLMSHLRYKKLHMGQFGLIYMCKAVLQARP